MGDEVVPCSWRKGGPILVAGDTLMRKLVGYITATGVTQSEAAKRLGVTQPRISDLTRGKVDLFSIDSLVNMLGAAGLHVDIRVKRAS
jgi:predicted XRE-type DNA-binding protein